MSVITLNQAYKCYATGVYALQKTTLTLCSHKMCMVTGPSGAGKSTLLRLILGLERLSGGEMIVANHKINRQTSMKSLLRMRRRMGVVLQEDGLIDRITVAENVALSLAIDGAPWPEVEKRVRAALHKVGLLEKALLRPPQLSDGERQRVNLAGAIIHKPDVIVADEPTGNLDSTLAIEMVRLLHAFQQVGVKVIMATHDERLLQYVPHERLHIEQGILSHQGETPS